MKIEEAIEILKQLEFDEYEWWLYDYGESKEDEYKILSESIPIILNLIDKLQKEVEDTKQTNANLSKEIKLMKSVNINENYISKDKIRDKIKELEKENEKYFVENGFVLSYIYTITFNNKIISILEELIGDEDD